MKLLVLRDLLHPKCPLHNLKDTCLYWVLIHIQSDLSQSNSLNTDVNSKGNIKRMSDTLLLEVIIFLSLNRELSLESQLDAKDLRLMVASKWGFKSRVPYSMAFLLA